MGGVVLSTGFCVGECTCKSKRRTKRLILEMKGIFTFVHAPTAENPCNNAADELLASSKQAPLARDSTAG